MGNADRVSSFDLVVAAVEAKENGRINESLDLLKRALQLDPNSVPANFEMGVLLAIMGRQLEAVPYLETAIDRGDNDIRAIKELAKIAASIGHSALAQKSLRKLCLTEENIEFSAFISQLNEFAVRFPLDFAVEKLKQVTLNRNYLGGEALGDRILSAVTRGAPFSFIRLGDGEGSHFKLDILDEAKYCHLYKSNRQLFRNIWFNGRVGRVNEFDMLHEDIYSSMKNADILGIPYESWIRHEYSIGSANGISSLTNIVRFLADNPIRPDIEFCDQNVHFLLAHLPFFDRLFKMEKQFEVISCHRDIGEHIAKRFNLRNVRIHKIPSEGAYTNMIGDGADERFHYPDVFMQIRESIQSRSCAGRVFIVSAGYLGKIYCNDVKIAGGVALDLGSIADGWMGVNTRPGMENVPVLSPS